MTRPRTTPLCWAMVALAASACGDEFAPYNRLASLRVLAIASEPVAPGPSETTALTPLVYTPPAQEVESYAWSFCPFPGPAADGYPCLVTEEDLAELGADPDSIPPFDLGDQPTATLENTVDPAVLDLLCEGTAEAPAVVDCEGGFPAQVKLTVRTGAEEVIAVRTLRLRYDPEGESNLNPRLDGLAAVLGGDERTLDDAAGVSLRRGEETVVRARVPAEVAERYTSMEGGEPTERRERLVLTWFVESGKTDSERTGFIEGAVPLQDALENEWKPARQEDYPRQEARLLVVVRDDRGGVVWGSARVALESEQ